MWVILASILLSGLVLAAIYCAVRAAVTARTAQAAVGWVVFLLAAPYVAVPIYLLFGQQRYHGYLIARRGPEHPHAITRALAERNAADKVPDGLSLGPFEYSAGLTALRGNSMRLLVDGEQTFDAIFAAIDAAREYVLVQFYIMREDRLGRALQARLIAATARGVSVRLMTDALGSFRLPRRYLDTLRAAGVEVVCRSGPNRLDFQLRLNYRNHRKTVIVDGVTGFTGGLNVGDEYMGRDPRIGRWRDTHIALSGPVVSQLQLIFAEDWSWSTGEPLMEHLNWTAPHAAEDMTALVVATGPADGSETGSLMFFSAISAARQRFWIASPYFVPDIDIVTALRHAALRGVDVRLLVPDEIDHYMPWLAAFAYFDDMIEAGVRIFRYTDGFMHQKAFLVDETLAAVGTTNLDNRSMRLNFESMALFFDAAAAADTEAMLRADFERAYELTKTLDQQPAHIRVGAPLARLFSPVI